MTSTTAQRTYRNNHDILLSNCEVEDTLRGKVKILGLEHNSVPSGHELIEGDAAEVALA